MRRFLTLLSFVLSATATAAPPSPIYSLTYSPDGTRLVAGGYRQVATINPVAGQLVKVATAPSGTDAALGGLAYSPNGRYLIATTGVPGKSGYVRLFSSTGPADWTADIQSLHSDSILNTAWAPNSELLATCGYDRLVRLWRPADKSIRELRDHSDSVYAVAFRPDGKLLASGAADRSVKIWETETGKRLYSLNESLDWVYTLAFSPDGKTLAGSGVDRSIRIWSIDLDGGKMLRSVFAHEKPVIKILYSPDGLTLFTASEDRTVKAWDTAQLTERKTYPAQPEAILSLALRPDGKQLALGRYDGVVVLLDVLTGAVQATLAPFAPKPPSVTEITPNAVQRGQASRVRITGTSLDSVTEISSNLPGTNIRILSAQAERLDAEVTFAAMTPPGPAQLTLVGTGGKSPAVNLIVDRFPTFSQPDTLGKGDSPTTGVQVKWPTTIIGSIDRAGDVDWYRFEARSGDQIGVQVTANAIGSTLEAVLQLTDANGRLLAESDNGLLAVFCPTTATYSLGIRDRDYRGGKGFYYRLHVGPIPVVASVFPPGVPRGKSTTVKLNGVNLGQWTEQAVTVPHDAMPGSRVPVPLPMAGRSEVPLGVPNVVVGEFEERVKPIGHTSSIADFEPTETPFTGNGILARPGEMHDWRFLARKGQRLIIETHARRIGFPTDTHLEILDAKGNPVPRAVLRCQAMTYTTLRDHDSDIGGIRLESGTDFSVDDYVFIGGQLLRILRLPRNPDDDCQFYTSGGRRTGFLDTTPGAISLGSAVYKVTLHAPGSTFPPNGMPIFTLNYQNDDGGAAYGKDSRVFFDPPADGEYRVRVRDARGGASNQHAYRLTVRKPRLDFRITFSPNVPVVPKGGATSVSVRVDRIDGFAGRVDLQLQNLPPGYSAPTTHIEAGQNTTNFALSASSTAMMPPRDMPPLKLIGSAEIEGKRVVRESVGGQVKPEEPGDIVVSTVESAITIRPGKETRFTVHVERRNGFKGRIPMDVLGLPHGVRVFNIGLNGVLITERETSRVVVLYAEPWVEPQSHPFVVIAKREGKAQEAAAPSVLLKVER